MNVLSDQKLAKLKALNTQGGFWYITKQNLVFRDLCFMAKILESWGDRRDENYQSYFDRQKTLPEFGSLDGLTAHRATKNCEYLGLTYVPENGKYSAQALTPFYFALKKICDGDFDNLKRYSTLVDQQLERIYIDSRNSEVYNVSFNICPFMFLFKILLLIGDITKSFRISCAEFKLFVATAQQWNEYFEVVESILRYRSDNAYKKECDSNFAKVSDVRYNILAQNHSQLTISGNDIIIIESEIKSVRRKVYEYELRDKIQSSLDIYSSIEENAKDQPLQQIFYGAPGTGKSHEVKLQTGELDEAGNECVKQNVFRTTFHPDTDYATFVGCYKPTMQFKPVRNVAGDIVVKNEKTEEEETITYQFVPQVFTDAYVYAYDHAEEQTYLVIEEINRGNCAQIFGDLFQLLDRNAEGKSEYTIKADKDLAKYLEEGKDKDSKDKDGKDILTNKDGIKDGKLCLPKNLNILATMNTSDQSLFPMDSAFKRRWNWEYVPISYTDSKSGEFMINIGENNYKWVDFIKQVNKRILGLTHSEDKQLGNFFIKSSIDANQFKSKVMFYLWYEVLRDEVENSKYFFYYIRQDETGKETTQKFTFTDLYGDNADAILEGFLQYISKDAE